MHLFATYKARNDRLTGWKLKSGNAGRYQHNDIDDDDINHMKDCTERQHG
jgi:hypothetical protein